MIDPINNIPTMMHLPLNAGSLLRHAARQAADVEVVSQTPCGQPHRATWGQTQARAWQLAQALRSLDCGPGDCVATLAWNTHRHLELYYGTAGTGLICHTVNPRLLPEQIAWIVNDAADKVLAFDVSLWSLVGPLRRELRSVRHLVALCPRDEMPADADGVLCYEDLLASAGTAVAAWPDIDERSVCSICYTSGTTGHPKGVAYTHRSTVLHAYASALPDAFSLSSSDVVLPIVPMFHVNAWGLPYSTAMVGCKLVLPGQQLDGASLYRLLEDEQVTFAAGVPTVWLGLLTHLRQHGLRLNHLRRGVVGGAACPPSLMASFQELGIDLRHAWGMTELSPVGTVNALHAAAGAGAARDKPPLSGIRQGRPLFGIELCVVDADGQRLPLDGSSTGELHARGHWVIERYLGQDGSPLRRIDGHDWFPTGDVANIDSRGSMLITDRSKDVIKSGGEWISSIELENIAMQHPSVYEAAVIACRHPKWDERPLLLVVPKPGTVIDCEALLRSYSGLVARWQIPDEVVVVDALPHTGTGKVLKTALREAYGDRWLARSGE